MTGQQPRYKEEEYAQRGNEIYERQVRPLLVEEGNQGKIVALDIETGAFEVAKDLLTASDRLLARCPDAQTWFVRIGHRAVHRFGSGSVLDLTSQDQHRVGKACWQSQHRLRHRMVDSAPPTDHT